MQNSFNQSNIRSINFDDMGPREDRDSFILKRLDDLNREAKQSGRRLEVYAVLPSKDQAFLYSQGYLPRLQTPFHHTNDDSKFIYFYVNP